MKALAASLLLCVASCSGFKSGTEKALDTTHNQIRGLRLQAAFVCKPALQQCITEKKNPCPQLEKCKQLRKQALLVLESAESAVKLGYEALATSEQQGGKEVALSAVQTAVGAVPDVLSLIERIKKEF